MNIQDFKASLPFLFKAQLTGFAWGVAGVGKSASVKQYAEEMGYKFFPFYLGTQSDLGDILGLAEFVKNSDGSKSTAFATPKWLTETIDYCNENPDSGAIIFLDEFNRARRDILNGIFSLALDKTFHTIKLPKNCYIIAAGNPPTDEYMVTDVNETALMSRFVHIKLEPTVSEWISYAKSKQIEPSLVGFIQDQPQLLSAKQSAFELPVKPDARAFERLHNLMATKPPQHILEQLMPGIIGLERTVAYQQYLKNQDKPLTGEQVLAHERPDLIEKWSNPDNVAASFLNITCDKLKEVLLARNENKSVLSASEKSNLWWFLQTVPKDVAYPLIKALVIAETSKQGVFKDFNEDVLYKKQVAELTLACQGKVK